jgi:hypothetical protein
MDETVVAIIAISCTFGTVFMGMVFHHARKLAELKSRMSQGSNEDVVKEIRDLKKQVEDLRDTTTRYDMSFDTALQRIEGRVGSLEAKQLEPDHERVPLHR